MVNTDDENIRTKRSKSSENEKTSIPLMLGDVIHVTSPSNEVLNDQTFIIDFINNVRLTMINTSTLDPVTIRIQEDGVLGDGTITDISLLYRNKETGYARQHKLLPGTWINLYFGGDIPSIITAQITDLEEDMIELKTHPEGDILYINFDYAGMPEDIPIDLIEIRKAPDSVRKITGEAVDSDVDDDVGEKTQKHMTRANGDLDLDLDVNDMDAIVASDKEAYDDDEIDVIPVENVRDHIQKIILQADDVIFGMGEEFAPLERYVEKNTANVRYSIEAQCNDLLDEMLSTIPNSERTRNVLRNIHTMIERFKQLRTQFSSLDQHGNVLAPLIKEADWKPLVEELYNFNKTLYWILPVAKNVKKVFNVTGEIEDLPNDVVPLNTLEDVSAIEKEMDMYKSNTFPDGQNKYIHMIKTVTADLEPTQDINPEQASDVIHTNLVNANLNVIVDNLGSLYSSVVDHNNINSRRFLIQKYNLGTKTIVASKIDKSSMTYTLTDLTPNDTLSLRSIMTLPEPVVRFSTINLPLTNILERTNLNNAFIQYWQLLHATTRVHTLHIDDIHNAFDDRDFLTRIKNFTLRPDGETPADKNEQYRSFLNKLVPKTRALFEITKKYIQNKVSLVEVVRYLEPFMVYTDDLTYTQYTDMVDFVFAEISRRIKLYVERSHAFFKLASMKPSVPLSPSTEAIYNAPNKLSGTVFGDGYDYKGANKMTNSELLTKVISWDAGRLYNSAISFENLSLMYPSDISKLFEDVDATNKELLAEYTKKNDCETYHIAKQYASAEQLEQDNNRDIYYDKKFDKTMYSILDNYEKDMSTKDPDEFIDFLVKKLEKTKKLSTDDALYLAETLISGMKSVRDGDYAFIFDIHSGDEETSITYYKRLNNAWKQDDTVDKSMFVNDEDVLCNIQSNCVRVNDKCESTSMNKTQLEQRDLKSMLSEFDQKYAVSKEDMEFKIREQFEYSESIVSKLNEVHMKDLFRYNNEHVRLGLKTTDPTSVVVSPYYAGLNKIIGQGDFVKKQNDIIRFTMQFTRKAHVDSDESPYWRYCIKTNTPLMPEFRYTLAAAFVNDPNSYLLVVEQLKATIGKISDDGNAWVDEHSGQVIQVDNFEFEDTYVDGFKDVSRSVMEKDAAQEVIGMLKGVKDSNKQTHEMKLCNNIIDVFATNMGINMEDQREFIIDLTIRTFHTKLEDEEKYKKRIMKASKDGKTLPTYNEYYNARILYYTMASFIISVQSSIPSITTRRTFPGCVTSFKGYPFEGIGDDGAINYISCIAYHIRNSNEPWVVLKKKKQVSIAEALKRTIQDKFVEQPEVKQRFQRKEDYLVTSPPVLIPTDVDVVSNWKHFLPPLIPFKVKKLSPLTTEFKAKMLNDLKSGYSGQCEDLLVVESKIIHYSLGLQERIQAIVEKQTPILKNMANDPFLENACCDTKNDHLSTIGYFMKKDKEIEVYNNMVRQMTLMMEDCRVLSTAGLFYSPINTKNVYPPLKNDFSEDTIYTAFIVYCRFNSILPVPDSLLRFCNEKVENIQPNESLREMIVKLKNDGRNYDTLSLVQLFQIVSREYIIHIPLAMPTTEYVQGIRDILKNDMSEEKDDVVSDRLKLDEEFRDLMEANVETFSMVQDQSEGETREFKNFLARRNKETRERLIDFVSTHTTNTQMNRTRMAKRFDAIFTFDEGRGTAPPNITDAYGYNFIHTIKTFVDNFVRVYPHIITNEVDYNHNNIPSYWGLSQIHVNDLRAIIKDDLETLRSFYSRKPIYTVLRTIGEKCDKLYDLMKTTPYFSKIEYLGDVKESVFDQRLSVLLAEYYMLEILKTYMEMTDDREMIYVEENVTETFDDVFTVESLDEETAHTTVAIQVDQSELLLEGNKKTLKTNVADLLVVYLELLHKSIDVVSISYTDIMDTVFKLKEGEKRMFTDKLAKMTDEQRNVDTTMKINKLGDWGKGLKSGIIRYDPEMYDEEKAMMEQVLEAERQVIRNQQDVTDRNVNQYMDDYMEQQRVDQDIDDDAYDMSHMTDDYDDGNYGGDEIEDYETYE